MSDAERAHQHATWSGAANIPRHDYLARLGMKRSLRDAYRDAGQPPHDRSGRPGLRGAALGCAAFGLLALASATTWPSFSACRTLAQSSGLYAGDSMPACTWRGLSRRFVGG